MPSRLLIALLALVAAPASAPASGPDAPADPATTLWYREPATGWQREALPIGNGRIGAMVFGGVARERIALNEETVWSGMRTDWNRDDAHEHLPAIRELLLAGKNAEAEAVVNQAFTCVGGGSRGGANGPWGCYQELGSLRIVWDAERDSIPLSTWKYKPITTPGITDIRAHRREVNRQVNEAAKADQEDRARREQYAEDLQRSEDELAGARQEWKAAIAEAAQKRVEAEAGDEAPTSGEQPGVEVPDIVGRLKQQLGGVTSALESAAGQEIALEVAHEIRNPASSIGLHADLLARDANNSNAESIGLIRAEVDRITDLVNQWLFVVRPAPPQSGSHDLVKLVVRIAGSLRTAMEHAGAKLRIEEPARPLPVNCDHARIEQVVRNLLINAMQAMPEGGDINVCFECTDTCAVLLIHDSGAGFSEDALRRFGEAFFSEREGGMGIGLTLAREVIAAHNGTIDAMNAPDGGAVVRVQLPHSKEATES